MQEFHVHSKGMVPVLLFAASYQSGFFVAAPESQASLSGQEMCSTPRTVILRRRWPVPKLPARRVCAGAHGVGGCSLEADIDGYLSASWTDPPRSSHL